MKLVETSWVTTIVKLQFQVKVCSKLGRACWTKVYHLPVTFLTLSRHLPDKFRTPIRNLPDTFQIQTPSRHLLDTTPFILPMDPFCKVKLRGLLFVTFEIKDSSLNILVPKKNCGPKKLCVSNFRV